MADTILTPGKDNGSDVEQTPIINPGYLVKDNLLSEFKTDSEKSVARYNLGVPAAENVYTKEEIEPVIVEKISKKIAEHLDSSDHITQKDVFELLSDLIKNDGTTPFTAPQIGVDPISNHDLTTKIYVDKLVQNCLKISDKNKILDQITNTLRNYVEQKDVYTKDEVYTKDQINNQNSKYIKIDGTTSFEKPQSGRTPQIASHLTTKGYVDNLMQSHKSDIDPHGFTEKLSNKLKKYVLKENVYDKTQTYSRAQLDSIIDKLVSISVKEIFEEHISLNDPHNILEKIKDLGYITKDGKIAFTSPQKGVDAVNPQELVTLHQLTKAIESIQSELDTEIKNKQCTWITSGPVQTTVGFVEDETELAKEVTLQEIMDAIFYGKGISINVPEIGRIGQSIDVTVCLQGTLINTDYAELYQDGKLIGIFNKSEFEESGGCITIKSEIINSDSEFVFKVYYLNGTVHEVSAVVKVALPVFVGLLPKWKFGNVVTYDYILDLYNEDPENNSFYNYSKNIKELTHKYNFEDSELQHPFMVIPANYNKLYQMCTPSQQFGTDAFDIIDMIPLQVPGASSDVIYKIYIYKQALASLNVPVTFKFETE